MSTNRKKGRDSAAAKLSRQEKKQLSQLMQRQEERGKHPASAQETIPYQRMWPDGVCKVGERQYNKMLQFSDINYQLALNEDKQEIFAAWCEFLNSFDSSLAVQFVFITLPADSDRAEHAVSLAERPEDSLQAIRSEYVQVLQSQLARGNHGWERSKYIVFGIDAENYKIAKPRLERIETDLQAQLKRIGVSATPLDGHERLRVLHAVLHQDAPEPFRFDWSWLPLSGLDTKDFIAPSGFSFQDSRTLRIGQQYGAAAFLHILAPELNDRILADFLDMENSQIVTLHIRSIDQTEAIKTIKRKLTDLDRTKIEEQRKAVRSGYDMDILPSDLMTYGEEARNLLKELQNRNERMFLVTILLLTTAGSKRDVENTLLQAQGIAQKHNCQLVRLDYQQENALASCLPLGVNGVGIQRGLTTSSTAIFIPFTTQELFRPGKDALCYGLNALSHNPIVFSRKSQKNPNGLILGTPGSGKSFAAKREMFGVLLVTDDHVMVCDPEGEYFAMAQILDGQVVRISPSSSDHINPLDFSLDYSDEENPLSLKADFVLSLCELIVGGRGGLQPIEKSVIDRAVHLIYRPYLQDPKPENLPLLGDLYQALREQEEKEAQRIAAALEIYVTGSLNLFNHPTNVDLRKRFVCYDTRDLGAQMKTLGMLIIQDQVWGRVSANRGTGRATWYYMDEFHLLLRDAQTAQYSTEIWKRFRKWGGVPTAITQNVKDLLASREVENILENSDFVCMLNQGSGDQQILAKYLHISPHQLNYVSQAAEGEGLLCVGSTILPFEDHIPKNTQMYEVMTTKPNEMKQGEKNHVQ